jgi:quercetin dioxygenase-like cupin family protein
MRLTVAVVLVLVFVVVGGVDAQQSAPIEKEKGVKTSNLVTSLGGFRGTANIPIVLTGQIVTIEPGGQTGRQRHSVASYVYVLEGTLTTNSMGGPVGVAGVQYHSEGQSYMDAPGIWHNHTNTGQAPVKYLLLLISTPGASDLTQKAGDD